MKILKWTLIVFGTLIALGIIVQSCKESPPASKKKGDLHQKYIFAEDLHRDFGGIFDKVKVGTANRIEITLDPRDRKAYEFAKELGSRMRKAGFTVLRIIDKNSGRYDDINL